MSNNRYPIPANVLEMAPYQAGKPIEELARDFGIDHKKIIKLASNENPLGFSDRAKEAVISFLQQEDSANLGRYPDANGFDLKAALAKHYQLNPDYFTLGNGSNDLLELISLAFLNSDRSCVYSANAFIVYHLSTQARAAHHIMVPSKNYGHDLGAMFNAIQDNTSIVYIANPNNPTGTFHSKDALYQFLEDVYDSYGNKVIVVLDEAYNEYLEPKDRFDSSQLVKEFSNLIILRTFSKAYGLAALRVGYAIATPEVTDYLNRVRQPFNVNSLALVAAQAALEDQEFLEKTYNMNLEGKKYLYDAFDQLNLNYVPSFTNFILLKIGSKALDVSQKLLEKGVIVRPVASDGLPEHLRISIGLPHENKIFIKALKEVLST